MVREYLRPFLQFLVIGSIACLQGCVPIVVGAAAGTGIMMGEDRRTSASIVEDESIEVKAENRIQERFGDQVHVSATSFNRYILLTGNVPNEEIKGEITGLVLKLPNVRNVQNELSVSGSPSLMSRSNDGLLSARVKGRLVQNENVDADHVKVVAENGSVYLMGLVTRNEADKAAQTAATTAGVEKVVKVFEYLD